MNEKTKSLAALLLFLSVLFGVHAFAQSTHVSVDLSKKTGTMKPIWAWFGYDEPNYTYMKDGAKLLTEISELSFVPVNVRVHNLLTSGDGEPALKWGSTNVYTEDKNGKPVYSWNIVDRIFDTYVSRGMRPLVQIGFMPEALSSKPDPYRHYWKPGDPYGDIFTGWAYPPKEYDKWRTLVYQWALHCIERYGKEEVETWYWEVWNEPDYYLKGTLEDYCRMYDYAADGLRKALPGAKIGGPHTTDPANKRAREYLIGFLEHCLRGKNHATGKVGSPIDYIGFHAKGNPKFTEGRVRMSLATQLRNARQGFATVASFPELKHLPVIIGEFDPEGCAACSVDFSPQNAYRNGTLYSSTVAVSFARLYDLARKEGVNLEGAVTWAFEFEGQPWFAGFRDLATNGVDKPVLNVFRMYGLMGGDFVSAASSSMLDTDSICKNSVRDTPDIGVLASKKEREAAILLWNYHDDNKTDVPPAEIILDVENLDPGKVLVTHYRVDEEHSNAYTVWKEMGSPRNPTAEQVDALTKSGQLQMYTSPVWQKIKNGTIKLQFELPRQGVSLVQLTW